VEVNMRPRHSIRWTLLAVLFLLLATALFGQEILIFGGSDHDEFLGCATCNRFDTDSIWNQFGTYGSKFSASSIWNDFSVWGSQFSNTSVFNSFARNPPVLVDRQGNFYGYFTANKTFRNRTRSEFFQWVSENKDAVLDDFDEIAAEF
jgi:hypothetical protein